MIVSLPPKATRCCEVALSVVVKPHIAPALRRSVSSRGRRKRQADRVLQQFRTHTIELTAMDYVRAAIVNAIVENMDIQDLWAMAEHAKTPEDFDRAVNELAQTVE